jgi:ABC-type Fe3+-hydroxamate transport system substrate-binding protein
MTTARTARGMTAAMVLAVWAAACSGASPTAPSQASARPLVLSGNLAFIDVEVGQTATATFSIANTGTEPLTVTSITGTGVLPTQAVLNWSAGTVPPGGTQPVTVAYRPTTAGSFSGNLIVTGDQTSGVNTLA